MKVENLTYVFNIAAMINIFKEKPISDVDNVKDNNKTFYSIQYVITNDLHIFFL